MPTYTLYSYYRSSCSWRVRLALELKGIPYRLVQVNLLKDEQLEAGYVDELNPLGVVPTLVIGSGPIILTQSVAILEYLEELKEEDKGEEKGPSTLPALPTSTPPALLPSNPLDRALVRQLVQIIASDCQPLQNLNVLRKFKSLSCEGDEALSRQVWGRPFIRRALQAYTKLLRFPRGRFSFGDSVTLADLCLIPQLYNARRFEIDVETEFPQLYAIEQNFISAYPEAYKHAHPDNCQ